MIRQPVDIAKTLRKYGASLGTAHETLTRLAQGKCVAIELTGSDASDAIRELLTLGVEGSLIRTPAAGQGREKELGHSRKQPEGA
jgi:hypothetical protein